MVTVWKENLRGTGYFANSKQELPILNWTTAKINKLIKAKLNHIPQGKNNSTRSPISHILHFIHNPNINNEDENILSALHRSGGLLYPASGMPVRGKVGAVHFEQLRKISCARKIV